MSKEGGKMVTKDLMKRTNNQTCWQVPVQMLRSITMSHQMLILSSNKLLQIIAIGDVDAQVDKVLNSFHNYSSSCKQTSSGVLNFLSPIHTAKQLVGSDTLSPMSFENLQKDDIFEESEDEDRLDICFASASRDVDISPGQQRNRKIKIYHDRNRSWDDKVTEECVPRHHW
ncbi:hypothetical protein T459_17436 [Capsicum annuum]|uniref:Uncharacterized protein n=1 Tax=Capsicum annuum TaxID=4072 RepID=A0A2G2ZBQ5_CAPAN|nr:hypothetical protein T459_17436 [Capsicum annuum]